MRVSPLAIAKALVSRMTDEDRFRLAQHALGAMAPVWLQGALLSDLAIPASTPIAAHGAARQETP